MFLRKSDGYGCGCARRAAIDRSGSCGVDQFEVERNRDYTTGERRPDNWDGGRWRWKSTRGDEASGNAHNDIDGNEIVTMIAPGPRDIVIKKQKPSGFFGTNLASYLTLLGCDSVIVVGTTTSGCVRATVVDAFSLNYRVILAWS